MILKFLAKLVMTGAVLSLLLYWYSNISLTNAVIVSLLFAVVSWFAGDQLILRLSNNATATVADALMSAVYLWIVGSILNLTLNFWEIVLISAIVGIAEWLFHRYMLRPDRVMSV
ncbi:DUF2512 family protein [Cohnella caldifontis]|uniref:DUF2512 family protein n=1 Tax=Cohnella caldifontis TaxID=3027471 RepID=UPI0023EC5E92|nr:DUF2512 family protein [Cohnella sp. YIM B05605]